MQCFSPASSPLSAPSHLPERHRGCSVPKTDCRSRSPAGYNLIPVSASSVRGAVGQGRLVNEIQDPDTSDAVRPLAYLDLVPRLNELLDVALHPWVEYPARFRGFARKD